MQITDILDNVSKVIVGKEEVTKKVITSILAGGHILLEDVPGMGKTMLAKTLAKRVLHIWKRYGKKGARYPRRSKNRKSSA